MKNTTIRVQLLKSLSLFIFFMYAFCAGKKSQMDNAIFKEFKTNLQQIENEIGNSVKPYSCLMKIINISLDTIYGTAYYFDKSCNDTANIKSRFNFSSYAFRAENILKENAINIGTSNFYKALNINRQKYEYFISCQYFRQYILRIYKGDTIISITGISNSFIRQNPQYKDELIDIEGGGDSFWNSEININNINFPKLYLNANE